MCASWNSQGVNLGISFSSIKFTQPVVMLLFFPDLGSCFESHCFVFKKRKTPEILLKSNWKQTSERFQPFFLERSQKSLHLTVEKTYTKALSVDHILDQILDLIGFVSWRNFPVQIGFTFEDVLCTLDGVTCWLMEKLFRTQVACSFSLALSWTASFFFFLLSYAHSRSLKVTKKESNSNLQWSQMHWERCEYYGRFADVLAVFLVFFLVILPGWNAQHTKTTRISLRRQNSCEATNSTFE